MVLFMAYFVGKSIGQNVDPETFPTFGGDVSTKNVYTNTGGEGKFSVDAIVRRARNGVNGQDSAGLGGVLLQNTEIFMGGYSWYNWSVKPNPFGGSNFLGWAHNINGCSKNIATSSFNNLNYNTIQTGLDTCNGELHTELAYGNIGSGQRKQFVAKYSTSGAGELFINLSAGDGSGGLGNDGINIVFDDTRFGSKTAMRFLPANSYTGDLIEVRKVGGGSVFRINNNGAIMMDLPVYPDDATADADATLPSGGFYRITGDRTVYTKP